MNGLEENSTVYWKVAVTDLAGALTENEGSYRKCMVNSENENPTIAIPVSPDSVIVLTLNPKFTWQSSTDPDPLDEIYYEMHVWNETSFDSVLTDTNSCIANLPLSDNSHYSWDVLTMDNFEGISHSEKITFWTDLFPEAPNSFKSISPANDEELSDPLVELKWQQAIDPDPMDFASYTVKYKSTHVDSIEWHEIYTDCDTMLLLTLELGQRYEWQIIAKDDDGFKVLSDSSKLMTFDVGKVSGLAFMKLPTEYTLSQNYPNPFNPITHIQYGLPEQSDVTVIIYNVVGRKIKEFQISNQKAGWHEIIWDGTNNQQQKVSTGIYIYQMRASDFIQTNKMVFMK